MTEPSDTVSARADEAGSGEEPLANQQDDAGNTADLGLHRMSRRLGERIKQGRKPRILKLICALMALSSGAARAQESELPRVTRDSSVASDRSLGQAAAIAPAPHRFDQSLVGSARLGISPPPVAEAAAARDPLSAFRQSSLRHRGPGVALMLVGAAGVITGLLIEESIITILGAGTGLVGLYLYLR